MQHAASCGVMLRRPGTPVISAPTAAHHSIAAGVTSKPGSRLCGAPLRKGYALHRVRDTQQCSARRQRNALRLLRPTERHIGRNNMVRDPAYGLTAEALEYARQRY